MTVLEARAHLDQAERALAEAQGARDRAAHALDQALAHVGWHRLAMIGTPEQTPLYRNVAYPNASLDLGEVVALIEQQRRVLA